MQGTRPHAVTPYDLRRPAGTPSAQSNGNNEDASEDTTAPKKAKKDKKAKADSGAAANGSGPAPMAEVGSVELARAGKPIKKDLYTKVHPEVAAMTADKVRRAAGLVQDTATCMAFSCSPSYFLLCASTLCCCHTVVCCGRSWLCWLAAVRSPVFLSRADAHWAHAAPQGYTGSACAPHTRGCLTRVCDPPCLPSQIAEVREGRATVVEGRDGASTNARFAPFLKFEHTGLPAKYLHSTRDFATPSPIQSQCWPIILAGHDLIGIAATGSGKTLGFGLPMLAHIAAQREAGVVGKGKGPYALVMAPTRELALQINQVLHDAGAQCGVRALCVYGGVPKREQLDGLRRGVEVVVGTPGRLEDLMNDGACKLDVSGGGAGACDAITHALLCCCGWGLLVGPLTLHRLSPKPPLRAGLAWTRASLKLVLCDTLVLCAASMHHAVVPPVPPAGGDLPGAG